MTLEEFNTKLQNCDPSDLSTFVNDNILGVIPAVFNDDQTLYDNFRQRIATKFGVEKEAVVVVGSAALGFSYIKKSPFSLDSDVDVAIVSEALFDKYSRIICGYNHDVIRHVIALSKDEWSKYLTFLKYFAAGWLRPDKGTKIMNKNPDVTDWWDYFKSVSYGKSEAGNHKVNAGIYKSTFYLQEYIKIGLKDHRNSIMQQGA